MTARRGPSPASFLIAAVILTVAEGASADDWAPRKAPPPARAATAARPPSVEEALRLARARAGGQGIRPAPLRAVALSKALLAGGYSAEAAFTLLDALVPPPAPGRDREAAVAEYAAILRSTGRLAAFATDLAPLFAARPSAGELRVLVEASLDLHDRATAVKALERLVQLAPGDAAARDRLRALAPRKDGSPTPARPAARTGQRRAAPGDVAPTALPPDPAMTLPAPLAAWVAATAAGDLARARRAALAFPEAEMEQAALAAVALAAGDRDAAADHVNKGAALAAATGRPSPQAVTMLLRIATALRLRDPAARLAMIAVERCRAGTVPAALAALSSLAGSGLAADALDALAGAVTREPQPPHDAPIKGLLAVFPSGRPAASETRRALVAALGTSDPSLRARVVAAIAAADPLAGVYPILRRSLEDQVPLGPAEIAALARTGSRDALAGVTAAFDRLPAEQRPVAVLAASALGGTDILIRAARDGRSGPAAALAVILLGLDGSAAARAQVAAAERSTVPAVADAARLGLALAGPAPRAPPPPPPGADCGRGQPGALLLAASPGPAAIPMLLSCAWHPDVDPAVIAAAIAAAGDPAAWRREAAHAARDFVLRALDGWPEQPSGARDLVDRIVAATPAGATVAALAGREAEVIAAARAAARSRAPQRVLADLSGVLPPARSGLIGLLRDAGRDSIAAQVYTGGAVE